MRAQGTSSLLASIVSMASERLLPVFGKPMIQCLRSSLTFADLRRILITTTRQDRSLFRRLLGDGSGIGTSSMLIRTVRADWRSC
ncbi:sugar phosphate nucleotidyltransferase [Bradyrhizobium sp. LA2.1]|uniref:sugar phosphate nucleotidyltransferase n=1 Tax=Bradyrhizobium sp. LA2.1 TaxID=3156376 RepID=UPI0033956D34